MILVIKNRFTLEIFLSDSAASAAVAKSSRRSRGTGAIKFK